MEHGYATAKGLLGGEKTANEESQLLFFIPGSPTSWNPIKAFQQGLQDEKVTQTFAVVGSRCANCGYLELYAEAKAT
jgi:hypothetical protein